MMKDSFPEKPTPEHLQNNEVLVGQFKEFLEEKGFVEQSVEKHVYNISYFLDEYLLPRKVKLEEAITEIDAFMGNWFLKKTPWVTTTAIQSMSRSLQNFYKFLIKEERVSPKQLQILQMKIKRSYKTWVNRLNATNY